MSIFSGTELPAWLNPGEDVFRNTASTAAEVSRNFMSAYQNAHEEKLNAPLRQVQLEGAKMQLAGKTLNLQRNYSMMEAETVNKAGESAMATAIAEISKNHAWTAPESQAAVWDIASKYPSLVNTPAFKNTLMQFDIAQKANQQAEFTKQKLEETARHNASMEMLGQEKIDATTEKGSKNYEPQVKDIPGFGKVLYNPATGAFKVDAGGDKFKEPTLEQLDKMTASSNTNLSSWANSEINKLTSGRGASKPASGNPKDPLGLFSK